MQNETESSAVYCIAEEFKFGGLPRISASKNIGKFIWQFGTVSSCVLCQAFRLYGNHIMHSRSVSHDVVNNVTCS